MADAGTGRAGHQERELDVVLLGATGFVGRLVAAHLARSAPPGTRIALAGRSAERLSALRAELGAAHPAAASWGLRTTDVQSRAALDRLAEQTRVVATTVGPYARWGLPVVLACAEAGTHYADLTGETLFVRESVAAAHATASASGARVVHSCGFDSVPSDLGVRLVADAAAADGEGTPGETTLHVREARGGFSGGTIDSVRQQQIAVAGRPELRRAVADPGALTGRTRRERERRRHPTLTRDAGSGVWSAPFGMGRLQPPGRAAHRRPAGRRVRADVRLPGGARRRSRPAGAAALTAAQGGLIGALSTGPTRALADRVLPAPGEGPSAKVRRNGRFRVEVVTTTTTGARYAATVAAPYDLGYDGTAVMFGESALALALDDLPEAAGVLTPMTGVGPGLADRLRAHGFAVAGGRS